MISGSTRTYAVLGRPIAHSRSPELHNAWFSVHGIDAIYVALEVQANADERFVSCLDALGLSGANLTAPLKQRALPQIGLLEEDAEDAGAVNTVYRSEGRLVGANTDVEGFWRAAEEGFGDLTGCDARIIGAGGAARAVAVALARRGAARIKVLARDPEQASRLSSQISERFPLVPLSAAPIADESLSGADLCVIATSGRPELVAGLDPSRLRSGARWMDLNYWDPDPPAFAKAHAAGLRVLDGRSMLLWQARLAFQRFTGVLPE